MKKPLYRYGRYLWRNRLGYCNICRMPSVFLHTQSYSTLRDDLECIFCRGISRNRHLVQSVERLFANRGVRCIRDLDNIEGFSAYISAFSGAVASSIRDLECVVTSEYHDGCQSGEWREGILCQNIEEMSFDSESFDLVITEDVLEHVQDYKKALTDIFRVLKKDGAFVFTVPFFFDRKTEPLWSFVEGNWQPIVHPIEYHGDSIRGLIPAFNRFGRDFFDVLEKIGFQTEVVFSTFRDTRYVRIYDCYTFVSSKSE